MENNTLTLQSVKWDTFKVGDIFDIENGKCSKVSEIPKGNTPYVGATNRNNGVLDFIKDESKLTRGNCIVFIYQ